MWWTETCARDERLRFVMWVEQSQSTFSTVCRQFGVSRSTGYRWLERCRLEGFGALADRSRAPRHRPHAISAEIAESCLAVRRAHPTWGPIKVKAWLGRRRPRIEWPAASTIGALFDREGL